MIGVLSGLRRVAVALVAAIGLGACSPTADPTDDTIGGEVVVLVAASLTDVAEDLAARFETRYPGVEVVIVPGGSQLLAFQLLEGLRADVFLPAGDAPMQRVAEDGLVASSEVIATNRLELVVAPGNPHRVDGLADLARDDLVTVIGAVEAPVGAATQALLEAEGVAVSPASLEFNVRAVVTKVALGEADVGVAYHSDVLAADGRVDGVPIPTAATHRVAYPLAVLPDAPNPRAAEAFAAFVRSDEGRERLVAAGLEPVTDGAAS